MTDDIFELLDPVTEDSLHSDFFSDTQIGKKVNIIKREAELYDQIYDLILIGCSDYRGVPNEDIKADNLVQIRSDFYNMEDWYNLRIVDVGNVKIGHTVEDTRIALAEVLRVLRDISGKIVLIGGSDDLLYSAYQAYASSHQIIELSVIDSLVDFKDQPYINSENYLHNILLDEPNFTRHLNVLGFQSYFVKPNLLEVMDNLRFDFMRLGVIRDKLELAEPMLRQSEVIGVDLKCIASAYHKFIGYHSPNGFDGSEICSMMRYVGMSSSSKMIGIFNSMTKQDSIKDSAMLCAQMIWYLMDGIQMGYMEKELDDDKSFLSFSVETSDYSFIFKKSKRTDRWWINIKDDIWLPCSYDDYIQASRNQIPERWLRAMEK